MRPGVKKVDLEDCTSRTHSALDSPDEQDSLWDHAIILTLTTVVTEMIIICFDMFMTNTGISSLQFFVMLKESFKK